MNLNIKRHDEKTKKSKKTSLSNNKSNLFNNDISLKSIDLYKDETKIDTKSRRKRRELSCSANNSLNKHKFSITLEFE